MDDFIGRYAKPQPTQAQKRIRNAETEALYNRSAFIEANVAMVAQALNDMDYVDAVGAIQAYFTKHRKVENADALEAMANKLLRKSWRPKDV